MKVLVVGSGAREHALAWKLSASRRISGLFCAPGNPGTDGLARNLPVDPMDAGAILAACRELDVGMVVIGPEAPLAAGLADALSGAGVPVFGPGASAARLEASKSFARSFSERAGVPCAGTARFYSLADFERHFDAKPGIVVLKKSGLAAGKGVLVSDDRDELKSFAASVLAEDELLAEDFLEGWECSVFAVSDGTRYALLPACADHKRAYAGDLGPNTGGMGAVCPVPAADAETMSMIEREIVAPSFAAMAEEELSYRGVLFFGVVMTNEGPRLLEYNVRFGDPETQSLLPLLEDDFVDLCELVTRGSLDGWKPAVGNDTAIGFVIAAPGYPGEYPKGIAVRRLPQGLRRDELLFHAGTVRDESGQLRTGGGRCFTAVGLGRDYADARNKALLVAHNVVFDGSWFRPDIGRKFFGEA